jgi:transposase
VKKSARQYQALLATVRPRDTAGKTRRRMAAEELADLHRLDAKLKAMKAELKAAVQATGSHLMDIHGIGPAGAARILADVGDIARFPDRHHFASRPAPPPSTPPATSTRATASPAPATAASTTCST